MTPAEAKLACAQNQMVIYKPHPSHMPEDGFIMRVTPEFAFVLYVGHTHVKATRFEDLELANP